MDDAAQVAAVRGFNRFYTRRIGALQEGLLDSAFSLAEVRVLYELAHRAAPTARDLARDLALDPGYLSRMLQRLVRQGLVGRGTSRTDARERPLKLTAKGRAALTPLERRSQQQVAAMLAPLSPADRSRVTGAMRAIQDVLEPPAQPLSPFVLRDHRPGDMGWVVAAHGDLYWREFGWDARFEALVAHIAAEFIETFDPTRERCWIAERDGSNVGSVFLVRKSPTVAKLRLLIVDPRARGMGLGRHLVAECIRFARARGYRKLTLWTQENLLAARHLYQQAGFVRVARAPHAVFGVPLFGETWTLKLG
jgi:DNA-binding MarR family transcriptional regulator/N-acetylglutamate synthase-like GNAT family acetyltransferase